MSSIDNRIVQMQFENSQFEKGAQESMSTLQKLKQSLDFSGTKDTFSDISASANSMDFSALQSGIQAIQDRFSTWGIVGMQVISELTSSAINMGKQLASITIGQINTGGKKRASDIQQAKMLVEGLFDDNSGSAENQARMAQKVAQATRDANAAVADTAYGLNDAMLVASQLATSGVEMAEWSGKAEDVAESGDEMSRSLIAVSGIAAMTGQEYSRVGEIFTKVAGAGKLTGELLNSFSYMGLNVAAKLADQMDITEAEVRDMVSKGEISFKEFANAMYDAYGNQAFKANRTFSGVMSNCKAALSKIGADLWTPLIQNNSELDGSLVNLVQVFGSVKDKLNEFRQASSMLLGQNPESTNSEEWGAWVTFVNDCCTAARNAIKSIDAEGMGKTLNTIVSDALPKLWTLIQNIGYKLNTIKRMAGLLFKDIQYNLTNGKISSVLDGVKKSLEGIFEHMPSFSNVLYTVTKTIKKIIDTVLRSGNIQTIARIFANIVKAVRNFQDALADNKITKNFVNMGDGVGGIFTVILNVIEKLSELLPPIAKIFGNIADVALDAAGAIGEFFGDIGDNVADSGILEGFFETIKNVLEKVASLDLHPMQLLASAVDAVRNAFSKAAQFIQDVWGKLCEFLSPLIEQVKNSFKRLGEILSSPFKADSNVSILDAFTTFLKALVTIKIASLADDLVNLFDKLGKSLESFAKNFKGISVGNFEKLAKALLLLAAAMFVLASVDGEALQTALVAMAAGIGELVGAFYLLKGKNLKDAKASLTGKEGLFKSIEDTITSFSANSMTKIATLAFAILELAAAMKILGSMKKEDLQQGLLGVSAALLILVGIAFLMEKIKPDGALKSAGSLTMLCFALIPMAAAIALLSLIDANKMYAALFALAIGIGAFALIIGALSKYSDPAAALAGATSILLVSLSLIPLVAGLIALSLALSALGPEGGATLSAAMFILIVAIGAFAGIIGLLANFTDAGAAIAGAASILLVSLALVPVTAALITLSLMNLEKVFGALVVLTIALVAMASCVAILASMSGAALAAIPVAAALLIVSLSLIPVAAALAVLSSMNMENVGVALVFLGVALGALCTALGALAPAAVGALVAAASFLVIGAAILVLVGALALLSALDTTSLALNLAVLGVALAALALNAGALSFVAPFLLTAAGGMAAFGAAMIVLGAGIAVVSVSVSLLAKAITDVVNAIVTSIETIINGLSGILQGVADVIGTLISIVVDALTAVVDGVKSLLGIHSPSTVFAEIGNNIIMGLINGITDMLSSLLSVVAEIPGKLVSALGDIGSAAIQAGKNFIDGLLSGITNGIGSVVSAVGGLASKMLSKVASVFDSHSPSKETAKLGKYFDQGLMVGMKKYSDDVNDTAASVGQSAMNGLNSAFDWIDSDMSPVITPILDLSEIQNGSNSLAAMMNQGYSYTAAASIASSFESPELAKSNAFNKTMSSAMSDLIASQQAEADPTYSFNIPLSINGRQIAKATRQYTKSELDALDTINNRKGGIR